MATGSIHSQARKRNKYKTHSRENPSRSATLERRKTPGWWLTETWSSWYNPKLAMSSAIMDKSNGSSKRRCTSGMVAIISALCSALLVVGAISLSRSRLPSSAGSVSGVRSSEKNTLGGARAGVSSAGAAAEESSKAAAMSTVTDNMATASRKLSRRPELKTRGGQLAFARFSLLAEYPHDDEAFTQGLCYHDGFLYESTGLLGGKSSVRKVVPTTGEVVQMVNLENEYFGEGMVILNNEIHSLTWRSKFGFTWDLQTFELKNDFNFQTKTGQGWGITTDGQSLIVSDGSQFLLFWDPMTMTETRRIEVINSEGRPLTRINELEMVKGYVLANVWFDDNVYKIDPETGDVVDTYNFKELYPKALRRQEITSKEAVLNGIAWDPDEDVLYVTGKLWPRMYKVKLHDGGGESEGEEVIEVVEKERPDGNDRRRRQLGRHEGPRRHRD